MSEVRGENVQPKPNPSPSLGQNLSTITAQAGSRRSKPFLLAWSLWMGSKVEHRLLNMARVCLKLWEMFSIPGYWLCNGTCPSFNRREKFKYTTPLRLGKGKQNILNSWARGGNGRTGKELGWTSGRSHPEERRVNNALLFKSKCFWEQGNVNHPDMG